MKTLAMSTTSADGQKTRPQFLGFTRVRTGFRVTPCSGNGPCVVEIHGQRYRGTRFTNDLCWSVVAWGAEKMEDGER